MKKFLATSVFLFVFGAYALSQYLATPSDTTYSASSSPRAGQVAYADHPSQAPASSPAQTPAPSAPVSAPAPAAKPKGEYADGTYTGSVADAYYGFIQVKATVSGGKLTDVTFLRYPSDRSTSRYINSQAMPILRSEAISAQSANVNGVSGATDSSAAFRQSLSSALAQAKNA